MRMRRRGSAAALWLPPIALMTLIFALSAMPSDDVDHGLAYLVVRKTAHFTEYALLAALWWRALRSRFTDPTAMRAALAIAIGYAITDEFHQTFVDGRNGSPVDVLIDAAGAATGVAIAARRRRRVAA